MRKIWQIIAAPPAGTLIERYDFYIFGGLTPFIGTALAASTASDRAEPA